MRRLWMAMTGLLLISGLLGAGCTRRTAARKPTPQAPKAQQAPTEQQVAQQRKQEEEAGPSRTPTAVKAEKPHMKVADPKGQWTFEAQAQAMTMVPPKGPYTMRQATGVYRRKGQPPVTMRADQIVVDEGAKRVTLLGSVHLATPTMQVEGPRIEYNLDTQEVRAEGLTKMTYSQTAVASSSGSGVGNQGPRAASRGPRVTARRQLPGG